MKRRLFSDMTSAASKNNYSLTFVGGASGVGKTTLLSSFPESNRIFSSGTFFKEEMSLASRDDVRLSDWTAFEESVTRRAIDSFIEALKSGQDVVFDTHFAAKVSNFSYRIGISRPLIYNLIYDVCSYFSPYEPCFSIRGILITAPPETLLERRRHDTTRNREIVPSDCVIALRENRNCFQQYCYEILRAAQDLEPLTTDCAFTTIVNDNLEEATNRLRFFIEGAN